MTPQVGYAASRMSSRARNKLTVKQVASLTKPGIYSDGGGLYVRVRSSGKSWVYINTLGGKRQEMGLGSTQDVSLAKARERSAAARELALEGKDPRGIRPLPEAIEQAKITFGAFAKRQVATIEDGFRNRKHRQQWRNTLATYAAPIADTPIDEVTSEQIQLLLLPIWLAKPETASRVRGRIEYILDAAKAADLRDGDNPARWSLMKLLLPKREKNAVRHHPALPFAEVAAFMGDLRKRIATAARALEFTILTAARSGEIRGMTWGEVDLKKELWTVPKERMKASVEHQVPLSAPALEILTAMKPDDAKASDIVFPAPRGGAMSDMALSQLLKRLGRRDITVHGFRSTFRDWAGENTNFEREVIEMALAHGLPSKVEAAYRRGRALEKRRDLMDAWADYCGV